LFSTRFQPIASSAVLGPQSDSDWFCVGTEGYYCIIPRF